MKRVVVLVLLLLTACAPTPADVAPQVVTVYATTAAEGWMTEVFDCAERTQGLLAARGFDISSADISLRIGEPARLASPAYQIGETEIAVAARAGNPATALTEAQVAGLFSGRIRNWEEVGGEDAAVQVWVYGRGDDLQAAFNGVALGGGSISSLARQATSPGAMRDAIVEDENALGILPSAWVDENLQILYQREAFPVLVVTPDEPTEAVRALLGCLQGR